MIIWKRDLNLLLFTIGSIVKYSNIYFLYWEKILSLYILFLYYSKDTVWCVSRKLKYLTLGNVTKCVDVKLIKEVCKVKLE